MFALFSNCELLRMCDLIKMYSCVSLFLYVILRILFNSSRIKSNFFFCFILVVILNENKLYMNMCILFFHPLLLTILTFAVGLHTNAFNTWVNKSRD